MCCAQSELPLAHQDYKSITPMSNDNAKPRSDVLAGPDGINTYCVPDAYYDKHPRTTPHLANLEEYRKLYNESITEPKHRVITYGELLYKVSKVAYTLREIGVKKGDAVAIYLPIIPKAIVSILACTRIGAVHCVVFAGFSSVSLRNRIVDAGCKVAIVTDEGKRGAADVWKWYHEIVGKEKAHVIDTYWQTETGSHVIAPLGGVTPTKPGSASLPFFGIEPAIVDPLTGDEIYGNDVEGVLVFKQPWPSMARTVWKEHKRYMDTYLGVYKGYYFTGDGASRDCDGYYWIRGRVDDVVNVSGHRLSTAEIEAAIMEHDAVAEAAVVGLKDDLTGEAVHAFVALKRGNGSTDQIQKDLILQVRKRIRPFATPKAVFIIPNLPKTQSGKILRRVMRKILAGEKDQLGDLATISNPLVVDTIIDVVHQSRRDE
ncbi:acetyl-CoA synthetase [Stagonosporopsis vannaccii]|nr:acetyl-CoA synthetase [Stagonosporopsis vannaccii]